MGYLILTGMITLISGCEHLAEMHERSKFERRQAGKVRVAVSDPRSSCKEIGSVESERESISEAKTDLRREAYKSRANYVRQESVDSHYVKRKDKEIKVFVVTGTAFFCKHIKNVKFDYKK